MTARVLWSLPGGGAELVGGFQPGADPLPHRDVGKIK